MKAKKKYRQIHKYQIQKLKYLIKGDKDHREL